VNKLADKMKAIAKRDFFQRREDDVFIVKMIGGYMD
jgi:hypothetical protein